MCARAAKLTQRKSSNGQNENTTQNDEEQELNWTELNKRAAHNNNTTELLLFFFFFSLNTLDYYSARSQNNYTTKSVVKCHL